MSMYSKRPVDFTGLRTISLKERGGKVTVSDFASVYRRGSGVPGLLDSLPHVLAGNAFRAVVEQIFAARDRKRAIIWGLGGHVIKCGLAPVLLDLMRRGFVTLFALNGAASIHDFEIALAGHTSEDVESVLPDGRFGSAEETGRDMNGAIAGGDREGLGIGESLGRWLSTKNVLSAQEKPESCPSLLLGAYRNGTPVTVHVAIGTDTPHTHPATDPAALGAATHRDFRLFCAYAADLNDGGVYVNCGSAVLLPEVFLKAVSAVRNLGSPLADFTTANFDFLQHYRPKMNVVERPHLHSGGAGYNLTGHHELLLPLLAAGLVEKDS